MRTSKLYLETEYVNEKTRIKDVFFNSPYKIMSPFERGSHIDVVQMTASAGLLAGDCLEAEFRFGDNSDVTYLSQSYEKVYNTKDDKAGKYIEIAVGKNAKVKYMPKPVIPFEKSTFESRVTVRLEKSSTFVYSDIFNCGRTGMGEYFRMNKYSSQTRVYVGTCLAFADNTLINPSEINYYGLGMWGDYTHNGLMYIYISENYDEESLINEIGKLANADDRLKVGYTHALKGIVIRALGPSGESIDELFTRMADKV